MFLPERFELIVRDLITLLACSIRGACLRAGFVSLGAAFQRLGSGLAGFG